ncbi:MAG: hypothetical protein H6610_01230 [Ignavibacteriales bacterium]|nr:hypothetical protein [Ignavibacteriales bacterium]MCB9209014.1 hypothetical protein [Ignavibacteriales bacterium]MCB9218064.1 hypothetical protein [Ignavibacteriales bacterium]MCB9260453.1 hypothetical protein [Ignavibacteriales bacterium]
MLKLIYYILIGYLIYKGIQYVKKVFFSSQKSTDYKVHDSRKGESKIDKKDIIDAHFEEIDDKENSSSTNQ